MYVFVICGLSYPIKYKNDFANKNKKLKSESFISYKWHKSMNIIIQQSYCSYISNTCTMKHINILQNNVRRKLSNWLQENYNLKKKFQQQSTSSAVKVIFFFIKKKHHSTLYAIKYVILYCRLPFTFSKRHDVRVKKKELWLFDVIDPCV